MLEKMNQASRAHMPGLSDPSAIPYQAADRVLSQGPLESNTAFILRLQRFLDTYAQDGSRAAVLAQVQAYLTGLDPGVDPTLPFLGIVGGNTSLSTWDVLTGASAPGAPPAHTLVQPANWNWDGAQQPWRAWLILYMQLIQMNNFGIAASVSSTGGSGVAGVTSGFATLTGMTPFTGVGLSSADVGRYLIVTGGASAGNNGTFQITSVLSRTSCIVANPAAVAPDANNGTLSWVVAYYPFIRPAPVWGSPAAVWGSFQWGVTVDPNLIISIRQLVQRWKSAGTYYPYIIVSFGGSSGVPGSEFSPNSVQGSGNPDGTWGGNGHNVGGVWVPSKKPINKFTSFCDGTGQYVQCTVQNVT
jgi:hypothetical protein